MIRSTAILLLAFTGSAFAQDLDYTYIQASYDFVDIDELDIDGDGLGLDASFAITDNLYLIGNYQGAGLDFDVDVTRWSAGLGLNADIGTNLDMIAEVSYLYVEAEGPAAVADDNGLLGRVGLRSNLGDLLELQGAVRYDDLSEDFGFDAGVLFNITDNFSVGAFGLFEDEVTTYSAGVRLRF